MIVISTNNFVNNILWIMSRSYRFDLCGVFTEMAKQQVEELMLGGLSYIHIQRLSAAS